MIDWHLFLNITFFVIIGEFSSDLLVMVHNLILHIIISLSDM